jgi:hypothetical protein
MFFMCSIFKLNTLKNVAHRYAKCLNTEQHPDLIEMDWIRRYRDPTYTVQRLLTHVFCTSESRAAACPVL